MSQQESFITKSWDLIVVGGGLTGIGAAVAAARQGLCVLLIEKAGALGGAPVNCLINPFMPYWTHMTNDGVSERFDLSRGIFTELNGLLKEMGALRETTFHEEYLKIALDRMVSAAGVQVLFHAMLSGVAKQNDHIQAIQVATKAGPYRFTARYFIDATGDADLAALSGCPYHLGRPQDQLCQPMTLCFRVANVDIEQYRQQRPTINAIYQQFQRDGKIQNPREDVLIFYNLVGNTLHFNSTRVVRLNPTDPFDLSRAEMLAREQMLELFTFLKENFSCFANSDLAFSAADIGVRESRMIDGAYTLTQEDLKSCIKFEDSIAAGNYDIDIHNPEGSGTSHYYFPDGSYYTIPYRCLLPRGADNLLVAGRCISSTHEAQASYRILPICCCLGEAAGIAASVAAKANVSAAQADVHEIQTLLRKAGAFIG